MKINYIALVKKINKVSLKNYYYKLLNLQSTPKEIAFSIALGIFIGLLFPIGLQTLIAIPIALLFGSNVLLTLTATLISNPITMLPIYYAAISIGKYITHIDIDWTTINRFISSPTFSSFVNLSTNGLLVFFTGASVMALFFSITIYLIVYRLVYLHRKKRAVKI